jgi:hypothetical protein
VFPQALLPFVVASARAVIYVAPSLPLLPVPEQPQLPAYHLQQLPLP